jgi:hypothetical protein
MGDIEEYYCDLWKETADEKARDLIWISVQNLRRLKVQISNYYQDSIACKENNRLDAEAERLKGILNKVL